MSDPEQTAIARMRIRWRASNRASRGETSLPTGIVAALPTGVGSSAVLQVLASDASPCRSIEVHTAAAGSGRYFGIGP